MARLVLERGPIDHDPDHWNEEPEREKYGLSKGNGHWVASPAFEPEMPFQDYDGGD
jgi:hypothetical protein